MGVEKVTTAANAMQVARNSTFQDRVRFYMTGAARDVMAEVSTTTAHAQRVTYAKSVLAGTADVLDYAVACVNNATILNEINLGLGDFGIPDSDLAFTVNSLFNAFAGVST
jgi:hypothetical protein